MHLSSFAVPPFPSFRKKQIHAVLRLLTRSAAADWMKLFLAVEGRDVLVQTL